MKKVKQYYSKYILSAFIFAIILFFKFLWLDKVPPGLSHDEIIYSLSSFTFFLHGTDITGTGFPIGLFRTYTEGNISIFPSILLSPLHLFFPLTQTTARLPYVFFALLSGLAVYIITKNLFNNQKISLIALFLFLLEPWSFFLSRFASDSPISLMFYLWGIATLFIFKGWKLIVPFLFFVLGFYSYHGGKILFLPLIVICLIYLLSQKKINRKESLYFFLGSLMIFVSFFMISLSLPGGIVESRKSEVFFLNSNFLSHEVNAKRSNVLENPFTPIFFNKFTVSNNVFFQKYLTAFSTKVLFLQGDPRVFYSFLYHGVLYEFDALFIPLGLLFIFLKQKRIGYFLIALLLISPLPSAMNGTEDSYINRSSFLLVVFTIFSAYGCYHAFLFFSKKFSKVVAYILFAGGTGLIIANFIFFYFFQYPIIVGDYYSLGEKIAAEFIKHSWDGKTKFVVVKGEPGELYLETVFFFQNKNITSAFIKNIDKFNYNRYELPQILYRGDCPKNYDKQIVYIIDNVKNCKPPFPPISAIKNPKDGGIIYTIYNSSLCSDFSDKKWLRRYVAADYSIESMSTEKFCDSWIQNIK